MRAITVRQPWATLIALDEKRIETRPWRPKGSGWLAIHAARRVPDREAMDTETCRAALAYHDISSDNETQATMPRGAIVAVVHVLRYEHVGAQTSRLYPDHYVFRLIRTTNVRTGGHSADQELALGDFSGGRWLWLFDRGIRLAEPVLASGRSGLWVVPEAEADQVFEAVRQRGLWPETADWIKEGRQPRRRSGDGWQ